MGKFVQQQLTSGQGGRVPVDVVLEVIQRSLVLVGNASNYTSQIRRDIIIRKLEDRNRRLATTLHSICKSRQPDRDLLFGSMVHKALSDRAETVSALQKAAAKVDVRGSGGSVKKFFKESRPSITAKGQANTPDRFFRNSWESMPPTVVYSGPSSIPSPASSRRDHRKISPIPRISETWYSPYTAPFTYPDILSLYSFSNSMVPGSSTRGWTTAFFQENWKRITDDGWILQIVTGCTLEFKSKPPLGPPALRERKLPKDQTTALKEEIIALVQKQAIKKLLPSFGAQGFYSDVFLVPKKDGEWRPIINLRHLNSYLEIPHFKIKSIRSPRDVVLQGDDMVKLDLQDAYLTVPMHRSVCKYLRFCWKEEVYEFQSLPFGLAPAPLLFTKLLKPLLGFL